MGNQNPNLSGCVSGLRRRHASSFLADCWSNLRTRILPTFAASGITCSVMAQGVQHLTVTQPGGLPGTPVLTGISLSTNRVILTWDGPSGYYQVWHKGSLSDAQWQVEGGPTNLVRTANLPGNSNSGFYKVSGPGPAYAGSADCAACHGGWFTAVTATAHSQAFTNALFVQQGGQTNSSCLSCHSVGHGLHTGFVNAAKTPQLAAVQCENCHGPGANHAANPLDPTVIPQVELAAQDCGGCHNSSFVPPAAAAEHPSLFEDWNSSLHAVVPPDTLAVMSASPANIGACGRCHSGSARLALISGQDPGVTLTNDFSVPVTCAVCHDPHSQHAWTNLLNGVIAFSNQLTGNVSFITNNELGPVYTNQLRCALNSTNDFVLTTSDVFTNTYDPGVNICGQCHNDRGSAWTDTARAPHESPQLNMLLGTVGELSGGASPGYPSTHSRLEKQCSACHVQTGNGASGHTFEVASYQLCFNCHSDPAGLVQYVTNSIAIQIQQTVSYLDLWSTRAAASSTNSALSAMARQYGSLAWEYTTPGSLSTGAAGPDAAGQALIPNDIKMARFDLYLVLYDGSYGVHNGPYDIELLQAAQNWIESELYQ